MRKRKKNRIVPSYGIVQTDEEGGGVRVETMGLHDDGLPEIVVAGIQPAFLREAASRVIGDVADYLLETQRSVLPGETILLGADTIVRVEPFVPNDQGHERWQLVAVPDVFCAECEGGHHEPWRERLAEAAYSRASN